MLVSSTPVQPQKTIIVVDDDRSILRVFTRVLEKKGYAVTAVETGGEAIKQLEKNSFDAALIDVRLPDINGLELLPKIQKTSPRTVRIVFTGSMDSTSLSCCNGDSLIDAFLIKPIKPEILLNLLDEKIKSRQTAND